eukprot:5498702-Amphidinium_carterae.1
MSSLCVLHWNDAGRLTSLDTRGVVGARKGRGSKSAALGAEKQVAEEVGLLHAWAGLDLLLLQYADLE